MRQFEQQHPYPGKLIIVEGIDGSGKSTQLNLLHKWLEGMGRRVFFTEWNSSPLVNETIKRGKKKNLLTPTTFSVLHAVDFADRLAHLIIPPLKAGMIVCADRYIYTAFSRDVVRGVDREWVRDMYGFAVRPDIAMYFRVPIEVSLSRILSGRTALKFHEAGMDLNLSDDPHESFRLFQTRILEEYDRIAPEYGLSVMDATLPITDQQERFRRLVMEKLEHFDPQPVTRVKKRRAANV
ncbi:MAG: thymidylate kinase [bacterium]|nr:thymidylate kinase [bacterium]MBK8127874.1 thymidylate kinase [bacterium]